MSGQSVLDRVTAAKHTITGSDLAKSVCKATTAEVMGPKKKHLDYLLQCTMTEHINIPELADLIIERTTNTNWVIVYKALSTCHNLMIYGHERFIQYLATRTVVFSLEAFMDKANVQGYDMSTYIRRYSKYLNQKALSYRTVAFDFCRVKRGKEEGKLRTMQAEKLLKTLPILQDQMDALLSFEISQNDLSNGIINGSFMLLFKDVIRLFACYNDGIINLLEKFFEMNKKDCKQALDIYKKFLTRMERVAEFLKIAEKVGIDKGEIPDLAQFLDVPAEYKSAPSTLLDALEAHLASLDSKKAWTKPASVSLAVSAFANSVSHIDSHEKRQAIEEEKERLAALKVAASADQSTTDLFSAQPLNVALKNTNAKQMQDQNDVQKAPQQVTPAHNNPFLSSPTTSPVHQPTTTAVSRDIFGAPPQGTVTQPSSTKLSSDLIGLTPSAMSPSLQAQLGQPRMPNQAQWGASNVLTATSSSPLHITAAGSPIRACASAPGSYKESFEPFGNAQTMDNNNPFNDPEPFDTQFPDPVPPAPAHNHSNTFLGVPTSAPFPNFHEESILDQEDKTSQLESVFGAPPISPAGTPKFQKRPENQNTLPSPSLANTAEPVFEAEFPQYDGAQANSPGITNNNDIGANFDKVFTGNSQQNANTQELFGDILQPMNSTGQPQRVPENPVTTNETGDLDTTLSKLATNISLDIRGSMSPKKAAPMSMEFELHGSQRLKSDHQWNKQSSNMAGSRTGGAAWQPVQMASTTWPQQQPYMGMGPRPVGAQPGMVGMYPQGAPGQHAGAGYPQQQPRMAQQQQQPNDPFGNL
ncbi:phosphatidylinositol-binding clathrin assembly protein-like isoform X3 [Asterias rubens]|uniref:phosphatidylinositol-binding clathrin assembly protein-like isoform X3 n=1 Tax=Asterias rubens TaxID=7604 RepID=UPI0014556F99|nr:phosphatidylinositol-binding clathrin assembly protein-like isoform X3 [Asterias rubens]